MRLSVHAIAGVATLPRQLHQESRDFGAYSPAAVGRANRDAFQLGVVPKATQPTSRNGFTVDLAKYVDRGGFEFIPFHIVPNALFTAKHYATNHERLELVLRRTRNLDGNVHGREITRNGPSLSHVPYRRHQF